MQNLILVFFLSLLGTVKAQFSDLDSFNWDSELNGFTKTSFPMSIIRDQKKFDSIRNEIHKSGLKYRLIEFDIVENPINELIFDTDGFGLPRKSVEKLSEKQYSLVNHDELIIRMIYLDPKI